MSATVAIATLISCLLAEAFFSGAELALISADKVALRHRAENGRGRRNRALLRFLVDPGQLITTALVGTNICVVLSTVVATLFLLPVFPNHAELLSLAVMTPLVLVFGEIVPKSLFQHYADRLAPALITILSAFRLAFYPFVAFGSHVSNVILRIFRLDGQRDVMSRDELKLLITLPSRAGEDRITQDERQMIRRIFEFGETTVEDVMVPLSEVAALPFESTMAEVAQTIEREHYTRIPLYRERLDQVVGIVHAFELLRAEPGEDIQAIARAPVFVPKSQPAVDTLVRLQREGQGMAVVVDEYGGAVGVVTIEDLLEEIVGEIEDEYDEPADDLIRAEPGGSYLVKGRAPVETVNEATGWGLPTGEDYESIAGLILDRIKRIPRQGQQLTVGSVRITVTRATERSIEEVRVAASRAAR
jgi:putative hemolysin